MKNFLIDARTGYQAPASTRVTKSVGKISNNHSNLINITTGAMVATAVLMIVARALQVM